jgi:hypothetical protein
MRAPSGRAGGILQCIVEQVRDDFAQQHRIAAHVQCFVVAGLVAALEAEIDVRRERARHPLGAGLERHRGEVDVDETRNLFARLRASERQQLVGQPHRAIGSRAQFAHGRIGLLRIARDGRLLGMQLHRGERRAQLVRGVGDERAASSAVFRRPSSAFIALVSGRISSGTSVSSTGSSDVWSAGSANRRDA